MSKDNTKPRFAKLRRVARGVVGGAVAHTIPLGGESAAFINASRTIKKRKLNKHDAKKQYAKNLAIAQVPLVGDVTQGYKAGANSKNMGELRQIGKQARKRWKEMDTKHKVALGALSAAKITGSLLTARYLKKRVQGYRQALSSVTKRG